MGLCVCVCSVHERVRERDTYVLRVKYGFDSGIISVRKKILFAEKVEFAPKKLILAS